MKLKYRVGFFLTGAFILACSSNQFHRWGLLGYPSRNQEPAFPIGVVFYGIAFSAMAFLPRARWVDRLTGHKPHRAEILQFPADSGQDHTDR